MNSSSNYLYSSVVPGCFLVADLSTIVDGRVLGAIEPEPGI